MTQSNVGKGITIDAGNIHEIFKKASKYLRKAKIENRFIGVQWGSLVMIMKSQNWTDKQIKTFKERYVKN